MTQFPLLCLLWLEHCSLPLSAGLSREHSQNKWKMASAVPLNGRSPGNINLICLPCVGRQYTHVDSSIGGLLPFWRVGFIKQLPEWEKKSWAQREVPSMLFSGNLPAVPCAAISAAVDEFVFSSVSQTAGVPKPSTAVHPLPLDLARIAWTSLVPPFSPCAAM